MVNWTEFENLPSSITHNFEMLCRSIIWLKYSKFGIFKALSNQPGIEFDIKLHSDCALGKTGQWFGWQCRWYDLPSGKAIGKTRKSKIEEALAKTVAAIPEITDWVLWTRHPLTKNDQNWFFSIHPTIRLYLWTSHEAESLMTGDAEILKQTYFGDLILTPEKLSELHNISIAPIKKRWLPDVHQIVDAERILLRMLGHPTSWNQLKEVSILLDTAVEVLQIDLISLPYHLAYSTEIFINDLSSLAVVLADAYDLLETGNFVCLKELLEKRQKRIDPHSEAVPRQLRGARLSCGLYATNALSDLRLGNDLLKEMADLLETRLVSVIADAGGGKTQLSASITASQGKRPAGLFLQGRHLYHGQTLDDLARRIAINGKPVASMQAMLAAINSAADREKCRLALVIDGLNEAEDPREWKPLLASLNEILIQYPNVLVVCTLRTGSRRHSQNDQYRYPTREAKRLSFADQALPDNIEQLEIPHFEGDTYSAIDKYFVFFRINAELINIPYQFLSHPLTLRIFCEVTNPNRDHDVGMEAIPRSLASMFERYIDQAAQRIEELSSHSNRHFRQDISRYLDIIGQLLWENNTRELNELDLRRQFQDDRRSWNDSIITLMEQEGILLRIPGERPGLECVIPVYDLLGGYLIAESLISRLGRDSISAWLTSETTVASFDGDYSVRHPLSQDVFRSLTALMPRRLHQQQLWQLVEEPLRTQALELATLLEGKYLDSKTVEAISDCIQQSGPDSSRFFRRIVGIRSSLSHPLNADFLDSELRRLEVGQRDLVWTEWIRRNEKAFMDDLNRCIESWRTNINSRTASDILTAKWTAWLLTTTIHRLRDKATLALYWFGRGDAAALFEITEKAADINDPYVFERLLAASYGVAMALVVDVDKPFFKTTILPYHAKRFFDLLFKNDAPCKTTHKLIREYGQRFLELTAYYNPSLFSSKELGSTKPPYSSGSRIDWQKAGKLTKELRTNESPFRMDFENYTLGRLVKGRRNYDYKNKDYQKVRAQVLWRISNLGWTADNFNTIDGNIEGQRRSYNRHYDDSDKVDRYGKKYSWIAYFELDGWLADKGLKDAYDDDQERTWDIDIDPSFPEPQPSIKLVSIDLLGDPVLNLQDWIENDDVPDFTPFFKQDCVKEVEGPWVLLDGYIIQSDEIRGRSRFAFIRSFFVAKNEKEDLIASLQKQRLGERWLPEKREFHYTFSGEIPWCQTFTYDGKTQLQFPSEESLVIVQEEQEFHFLDGEPIILSWLDRLRLDGIDLPEKFGSEDVHLSKDELSRVGSKRSVVDAEKIKRNIRTFDVMLPTCDIKTPGQTVHNSSTSGISLNRAISELLELENIAQSFDLQTKNRIRATIQSSYMPDSFANGEIFFFIREELLNEILEKLGMSLIFCVWGERQISSKQLKLKKHDVKIRNRSYGEFQNIYAL